MYFCYGLISASSLLFDLLSLLCLCNNNKFIDSNPGSRFSNSVDEGQFLKNRIFAKNSSLGIDNSADIWRSNSPMFFDILSLLWMHNDNIDSDPGVDFEIPLTKGQTCNSADIWMPSFSIVF